MRSRNPFGEMVDRIIDVRSGPGGSTRHLHHKRRHTERIGIDWSQRVMGVIALPRSLVPVGAYDGGERYVAKVTNSSYLPMGMNQDRRAMQR